MGIRIWRIKTMKSKIKFTKYFGGKPTFSFRFASAHDTPGISTPSTARFIAKVTWPKLSGSGGSVEVTYSSDASTHGLTIDNTEGGSVTITRTDGTNVNSVQESLSGSKIITVEGGWYNITGGKTVPFAGGNEADAKLAMPKQEVTRTDCMILNYTKKIDMAVNERNLLNFSFDGDYVGLQSEDTILVVKGKNYKIKTYDTGFELDNETYAHINSFGNLVIKNSTPVNTEITYKYGLSGEYSGKFKVYGNVKANSTGFDQVSLRKMFTSKHKMSSSQYDDFSYNGTDHKIYNKVFTIIDLRDDFKLHGNADFAGYKYLHRLDCNFSTLDLGDVTELEYVFAQCKNMKNNQLIRKLDMTNVTSIQGLLSGTTSYEGKIRNTGGMRNLVDASYAFEYSNFNYDITGWQLKKATTLEGMFEGSSFNQDIEKWGRHFKKVSSLKNMFKNNYAFNQDINEWGKKELKKTSFDKTLEGVFHGATAFNKSVSLWKHIIPKVTSLKNTFNDATAFNQTMNWGSKLNQNKITDVTNFLKNTTVTGSELLKLNWKLKNAEGVASIFKGNDSVSDDHKSSLVLKQEGAENEAPFHLGGEGGPKGPVGFDESVDATSLPAGNGKIELIYVQGRVFTNQSMPNMKTLNFTAKSNSSNKGIVVKAETYQTNSNGTSNLIRPQNGDSGRIVDHLRTTSLFGTARATGYMASDETSGELTAQQTFQMNDNGGTGIYAQDYNFTKNSYVKVIIEGDLTYFDWTEPGIDVVKQDGPDEIHIIGCPNLNLYTNAQGQTAKSMFQYKADLTKINLSQFTGSTDTSASLFKYLDNVTYIDIRNTDFSSCQDFTSMFEQLGASASGDAKNFIIRGVNDIDTTGVPNDPQSNYYSGSNNPFANMFSGINQRFTPKFNFIDWKVGHISEPVAFGFTDAGSRTPAWRRINLDKGKILYGSESSFSPINAPFLKIAETSIDNEHYVATGGGNGFNTQATGNYSRQAFPMHPRGTGGYTGIENYEWYYHTSHSIGYRWSHAGGDTGRPRWIKTYGVDSMAHLNKNYRTIETFHTHPYYEVIKENSDKTYGTSSTAIGNTFTLHIQLAGDGNTPPAGVYYTDKSDTEPRSSQRGWYSPTVLPCDWDYNNIRVGKPGSVEKGSDCTSGGWSTWRKDVKGAAARALGLETDDDYDERQINIRFKIIDSGINLSNLTVSIVNWTDSIDISLRNRWLLSTNKTTLKFYAFDGNTSLDKPDDQGAYFTPSKSFAKLWEDIKVIRLLDSESKVETADYGPDDTITYSQS